MKKLYVVIVILIAVGGRYAFKSFNAPAVTPEIEQSTGEVLTGEEMNEDGVISGSSNTITELEEPFDTGEVPMAEGSEDVSVDTGVSVEVQDLIDERNEEPKDDGKLTEDDIDLMQDIIDKISELGK